MEKPTSTDLPTDAVADDPGRATGLPVPVEAETGGGGSPRFTLRRSRTDRMVAGVCGGLAAQLGVDTALVRIAFVLATVFGTLIGAVVYLAAWALVPEQD